MAGREKHGVRAIVFNVAAKKRVPPPQPVPNRTWHELTKAEQSAAYSAALQAYAKGNGTNPKTRGNFFRERAAQVTSPAHATSPANATSPAHATSPVDAT